MYRNALIAILVLTLLTVLTYPLIFNNKMQNSDQLNVVKEHEHSIFIDIEVKRLYFLENNKCIRKYPIASGKSSTPSPIGFWKIISKSSWGGGFGERWMGLNVPWGKYGIHGTNRPRSIGCDISGGCIRMLNRDVKELYGMVSHGTPVVIVNGCFGPFGRGFRPIKAGDRGADVYVVQKRLKELGYYNGYVDGIYGEGTKRAVHSYQKDYGLAVKNTITRSDLNEMGFREFD